VILRLLPLAALCASAVAADARRIGLEGTWSFRLDGTPGYADTIFLPGGTDQGGYGTKVAAPETGHLTRPHKYEGRAWYEKQVVIPESWRGQRITLFLERPHIQTEVQVDGRTFGTQNSLSTPHIYDLTAALTPGPHRITICVDNTYRIDVGRDAHSLTEHTQTNWNGIVGRIELRASPPVWIDDVAVYPDVAARRVRATGTIRSLNGDAPEGTLLAFVDSRLPAIPTRVLGGFDIAVPMADSKLWDEYEGSVYTLALHFGNDTVTVPFGMRQIGTHNTQFMLNGRPIFLRGTLECSIFPLTGYPPTNEEEWDRLFGIARSYGLNAFRFHSYCPRRLFAPRTAPDFCCRSSCRSGATMRGATRH
jgi:beta-galactosidase/beta-glucuronidase